MRGRRADDPIADMVTCGLSYRQFAIDNPTLYSVMFDRVVPDFQPSSRPSPSPDRRSNCSQTGSIGR
jgi:hypothetical protein